MVDERRRPPEVREIGERDVGGVRSGSVQRRCGGGGEESVAEVPVGEGVRELF